MRCTIQAACERFNTYATEFHNSAVSDTKSKEWIDLLLACDFVELVQKMWRQYMSPELLERIDELPAHIANSLSVNAAFWTVYTTAASACY